MSTSVTSQLAVLLAFAGLVGWGAASDCARFIIPNRVCLAIAALYPAHVVAAGGAVDWTGGLVAGALTFAVGCGLFALRLAGGGDIKFISAIMLWVGPALFWPFMTVTALAGGLLAVAVLVATRTWRTLAVRVIGLANGVGRDALPGPVHVPYGVAIAGGGLYVAAELALAVIHP